MALVEEYYELNEAEEVSAIWKVIQIAFYVSAACLGLWCGYTIALLRIKFDDKCYLFTTIKLNPQRKGNVNHANINWENDSWCDYCQYSMVSSFIVATIWATFFLMCGKGGKSLTGLPQPWRIVWPSLIFNLIYFIVSLSTAINIQQGTDHFCQQLLTQTPLPSPKALANGCPPLKIFPIEDHYITTLQLEIVTKTSWGCVASWLILFLVSFARIIFVIDFNLYRICVFKIGEIIQNKREEVLRITNYEEPKKIHFDIRNNTFSYMEIEESHEEISRRNKISKRPMPIQPNAAFYITTDIRLLNREKQMRKSFKLLDPAFQKNKTNSYFRQLGKRSRSPDLDHLRMPSILYRRDDPSEAQTSQDDSTSASFSTTPTLNFFRQGKPDNQENDPFLRFKKKI